jgi:hypothetical protein
MKNLKERILAMGGSFKKNHIHILQGDVPYFDIKHCQGKGNPNMCGAEKYHQRKLHTNIWKTVCVKCKRKWTA